MDMKSIKHGIKKNWAKYLRLVLGIATLILFIEWLNGDLSGMYPVLTLILVAVLPPIINTIFFWKTVKPMMLSFTYQLWLGLFKVRLNIPPEKMMIPIGDDEDETTGNRKDEARSSDKPRSKKASK